MSDGGARFALESDGGMRKTTGTGRKIAGSLAIAAVSASLGLFVDWNAPGLTRYARDWLVRTRAAKPKIRPRPSPRKPAFHKPAWWDAALVMGESGCRIRHCGG